MAEKKKAVHKLTRIRNWLLILGAVLAVFCVFCAIRYVQEATGAEMPIPVDKTAYTAAETVPSSETVSPSENVGLPETLEPTRIQEPAETQMPLTISAETGMPAETQDATGTTGMSAGTEEPAETGEIVETIEAEETPALTEPDNAEASKNAETTIHTEEHAREDGAGKSAAESSPASSTESETSAETTESEASAETVESEASAETAETVQTTGLAVPTINTELETEPEMPEVPYANNGVWLAAACISMVLLAADLLVVGRVQGKLKKAEKKKPPKPPKPGKRPVPPATQRVSQENILPEIGKVHGIGSRSYQQDSLGSTPVLNGKGILAMVADGMGGLADGDQVSQQIIMNGLNYGAAMTSVAGDNPLLNMVSGITEAINRMLGPERIYKCGSTLIAVLVVRGRFHWISVGDSRIYLFREGYMNQLNTDHDLMQCWMPEVLAGDRTYDEAEQNPDGRKLTSFIGMGELKHVDYSRMAIRLKKGDRLVLMTDGIYGTVPPEAIAEILKACPSVSQASAALERQVRAADAPHQDNYTALILGF